MMINFYHPQSQIVTKLKLRYNPNWPYSQLYTGTTHNGGGMRPPLTGWTQGDYLTRARKTTPIEAARMASLPDEYVDAIKAVNDSDEFAFTCINMGVPLGTANAINEEIVRVLEECKVMKMTPAQISHIRESSTPDKVVYANDSHTFTRVDDCPKADMITDDLSEQLTHVHTCEAGEHRIMTSIKSAIRSIQVDTGTDATLVEKEQGRDLTNKRPANAEILVADNTASMPAEWLGDLPCVILNTLETQHDNMQQPTVIDWTMPSTLTVERVRRSLLSIEQFYSLLGYEMHLLQPQNGQSSLTNVGTGGNVSIPIRHDAVKGGFWIDYIPMKDIEERPKHMTREEYVAQQMTLLVHIHEEYTERCSAHNASLQNYNAMTMATAHNVQTRLANSAAVKAIVYTTLGKDGTTQTKTLRHKPVTPFYAQDPNEREVRGVKSALKKSKRDLKFQTFHDNHGHMGTSPWCKICRMVKGAMRRIYKVLDPYKPRVPGYAWVMDMIVVSDRAHNGEKYLIVLKCRSSDVYQLLPIAHKNGACTAVAEWIRKLRNNPLYNEQSYPMVSHILTDADGAWRYDNA